jgi:hypothetical protein
MEVFMHFFHLALLTAKSEHFGVLGDDEVDGVVPAAKANELIAMPAAMAATASVMFMGVRVIEEAPGGAMQS